SSNQSQSVEVTGTNPSGADLRLEYRVGEGPWVTVPGISSPVSVTVAIPRSARIEQRVLYIKATALDSGLTQEIPYLVDWDHLPQVVWPDLRPLIGVSGEQIGWRLTT